MKPVQALSEFDLPPADGLVFSRILAYAQMRSVYRKRVSFPPMRRPLSGSIPAASTTFTESSS
jgi:hypothetical protein